MNKFKTRVRPLTIEMDGKMILLVSRTHLRHLILLLRGFVNSAGPKSGKVSLGSRDKQDEQTHPIQAEVAPSLIVR